MERSIRPTRYFGYHSQGPQLQQSCCKSLFNGQTLSNQSVLWFDTDKSEHNLTNLQYGRNHSVPHCHNILKPVIPILGIISVSMWFLGLLLTYLYQTSLFNYRSSQFRIQGQRLPHQYRCYSTSNALAAVSVAGFFGVQPEVISKV